MATYFIEVQTIKRHQGYDYQEGGKYEDWEFDQIQTYELFGFESDADAVATLNIWLSKLNPNWVHIPTYWADADTFYKSSKKRAAQTLGARFFVKSYLDELILAA